MGHRGTDGTCTLGQVEDILARIRVWSRTFTLISGPWAVDAAERAASADPLGGVWRGDELADPATGAAQDLIGRHARARTMDDGPAAASLAFQRYAHRVAGVGVAAWVEGGVVVDVSAPRVRIVVRDGSPHHLVAGTVRARQGGLDDLVRTVVDDHLAPAVATWHAVSGLPMDNLWGNVAASLAAACRQLSKVLPAGAMQEIGEDLLASRPELADGGTFRILTGPDGPRLFFDRATCCHWHAARGEYCSWCPHTPYEERTARFEAMLASDRH